MNKRKVSKRQEYYELGVEADCDCNLSKHKALIIRAEEVSSE